MNLDLIQQAFFLLLAASITLVAWIAWRIYETDKLSIGNGIGILTIFVSILIAWFQFVSLDDSGGFSQLETPIADLGSTPVPPPPTLTNTATPVPPPPTLTNTATSVPPPPTLTNTATPVPPPPTLTNTATSVPPPPTLTNTATPVPPPPTLTNTATSVPPPPTLTNTATSVPPLKPVGVIGFGDDEWIKIQAGPFYFGIAEGDVKSTDTEFSAIPNFDIPYDYWISKYEVTNAQYKLFIESNNSRHLPGRTQCSDYIWNENGSYDLAFSDHPVVCISWFDAIAYVNWLSINLPNGDFIVMLPSEPEWEKAARGPHNDLIYPWGNEFDGDNLNCSPDCRDIGFSSTAPVGSFPSGVSPYGVEDMAGNVWEWTRSKRVGGPPYNYTSYDPNDGREDLSGGEVRMQRGGSWTNNLWTVRISNRNRQEPTERQGNVGFRVIIIRS